MDWVVRAVTEIRTLRSEMNVPNSARLRLGVRDAAPEARARLERHDGVIRTLARLEATFVVPLAGVIDPQAEARRLAKEIDKQRVAIEKIDRKLSNSDFLAKADPEVVEEQRERRAEAAASLDRLEAAAARLRAM